MAGPIRISVLADVGQAVKSVTHFSDVVDSETKRVVTSLGDSKLTGGFGKAQEGFDVLDTRAMGFRDTITGVQDTMTGWQIVSGQTQKVVDDLTAKVGSATSANDALKAKLAGLQTQLQNTNREADPEKYAALQAQIAATKGEISSSTQTLAGYSSALSQAKTNNKSFADGLFSLGSGVGDLASGFANIIIPAAALVTTLNAVSLASLKSTASMVAQKVAMAASAVASGAMTAAQWALNIAMSANPIAIIVLVIIALVAAIILAYNKSATFRAIVQALGAAFTTAIGAVGRFVSGALSFLGGLPGKIGAIFGKAKTLLTGVGSDIVNGLKAGIEGAWHWVTEKLNGLVNAIPEPVRKLLGIASPSKVFAKIGSFVGLGFAQGIEGQTKAVANATKNLVSIPSAETASLNGSIQIGALTGSSASSNQTQVALEFKLTGDTMTDAVLEMLRKSIRVRGGNVQAVLGR